MLASDGLDEGWVRRAQVVDRNAFSELARRHRERMYRSHEDALELTQDAFVKARQALPQWQPEAQFRTWLFRIANNTVLRATRLRLLQFFHAQRRSTMTKQAYTPSGPPTRVLKRTSSEAPRIEFLLQRDGAPATLIWVWRTLAIYRRSVLDRRHFAHTAEYRRKFVASYLEFRRWPVANGGYEDRGNASPHSLA